LLAKVEVEYITVQGWQTDISKIRNYNELPAQAKEYIGLIEQHVGVEIDWIGVGPGRESMLRKR